MKLIFVLVLCSLFASHVHAESWWRYIAKIQSDRSRDRFTIEDWLFTKRRIRLMDKWLALNNSSKSIFEGSIEAQSWDYENETSSVGTTTTTEGLTGLGGEAQLFLSIFGIKGGYFDSADESHSAWRGSVNLRLFGTGLQNTNLTIGYGYAGRRELLSGLRQEFEYQYAEGQMTLYLLSWLGIEGVYRQYLTTDSALNSNGLRTEFSGNWVSGMAFIELGRLRLFGQTFVEKLEFTESAVVSERNREGLMFGLRGFF